MTTTCQIDESIQRKTIGEFAFPLGVYPIEPMEPRAGYTVTFESADADNEDDADQWERWPDRYVYDVVLPAPRVRVLMYQLLSMMPPRLYPILDFIGHDAFREIDPFIAYEPVGLDRLLDGAARFAGFFYEDGMCGFGAMCDDPFIYVFLDEHKIITIRCEADLKPEIERVLEAFDLAEIPEPAGSDAAAHEHRGVLVAPDDRPAVLAAEEIVEQLRDEWRLTLNVDSERNLDEGGRELGPTAWRCLLRWTESTGEAAKRPRVAYAEILIVADALVHAEEIAFDAGADLVAEAAGGQGGPSRRTPGDSWAWLTDADVRVIVSDRLTTTQLDDQLKAERPQASASPEKPAAGKRKGSKRSRSASSLISGGAGVIRAIWL